MPTGTRNAKVSIGGDTTGLTRALAKSKGDLTKWSRDVKVQVGGALRGSFQGLGAIAGFTGLGSIALAARETKAWNDRLVALQQTTGLTRAQILRMNDAIQETATRTGVQQTDLLAGIEKFQEVTGEATKFTSVLGDMANVATATNAKMEDIAATAAAVSQALGVTSGEMGRVFDVLAVQGDRGAVELKNLASMMPQLAAMASKFQTQGVEGVAEWGAVMQVVKRGTGTASEALTQTVDLAAALLTHWEKLEKHGVKIFSDKEHKKTRDFLTIVDEINKKIPRAELARPDIMGSRKEALFALDSITKYRGELESLRSTADKTGAIVRKNQDYNASSTAQFNRAMASLHKTANDLFMTSLPGLASAFERVAAALKWMVDHQAAVISMLIAWKAASAAISLAGAGAAAAGVAGAGAQLSLPGIAGGAAATTGILGVGGTSIGALAGAGVAGIATIVSGVLAAGAGGYAAGSLLYGATPQVEAAGMDRRAYENPYSPYQARRRYAMGLDTMRLSESEAIDYAKNPGAAPGIEERFQQSIGRPGSAAALYPGGGARPGETARGYIGRQSASAADAIAQEQVRILGQIAMLLQNRAAERTAAIIVDLQTVNDKLMMSVKNSKQRRRAP